MNLSVLGLVAFSMLSVASPQPIVATEALGSADLTAAIERSEFAEIYLIDRRILFAVPPRPATVKSNGCRYFLQRSSAQWAELERSLASTEIRLAAGTAGGEVRVALVLGDSAGTLWEAYARYPYPSESTTIGISQRRQVVISAGFADALASFAARHPELAMPSSLPVCHGGSSP